MSSTVHACLAWSTRQPILLQCTVHSTCHNLAWARIFNPVPCQNQPTTPAVWCNSECSHKCFNERSRQNHRQKVFNRGALHLGRGDNLKIYENNGFIMFHISILGSWSFVWGSRLPMTTRLGPEQLRWGRAWGCSWDLWLKWIKAKNRRRVTEQALMTVKSTDDE